MPANLKTVPGVNSGNSRETRVRNFINRMPGQAVRLVLSAEREDAGPMVLLDWPREAVVEDLAPVVLQTLQDHMLDTEQLEVVAVLAFVDSADRVCASMTLKDRARDLTQQLQDMPMGLGTSTRDQVAQQMQQNERMHRLYIAGQATLQQHQLAFVDRATGMNERLIERLATLEERLSEKEAELDALAAMVREHAAAAERAINENETGGGIKKGIEILMNMLPLLAGQRALPRHPPSPPPATQQEPSDAE